MRHTRCSSMRAGLLGDDEAVSSPHQDKHLLSVRHPLGTHSSLRHPQSACPSTLFALLFYDRAFLVQAPMWRSWTLRIWSVGSLGRQPPRRSRTPCPLWALWTRVPPWPHPSPCSCWTDGQAGSTLSTATSRNVQHTSCIMFSSQYSEVQREVRSTRQDPRGDRQNMVVQDGWG